MNDRLRIAVYNRHWSTAGGGERYAGAIAQALAQEHEVDLLTPERIDWRHLEERLGLDVSAARPVFVEDAGFGTLAEATRAYDLLVNCSYMSSEPSGARHGIYVVLFPTGFLDDLAPAKRLARAGLRPLAASDRYRLEWGKGFHLPERSRRGTYRWTSGEALLHLWAPAGERVPVRLVFGARPGGIASTALEISVNGRTVGRATVDDRRRSQRISFEIAGLGDDEPVRVAIRSDAFDPSEALGTGDSRSLGVKLRSARVGSSVGALVRERFPRLTAPAPPLDFLETYDHVVSISEFTRSWVQRLWERDTVLLYPPVDPIPRLAKDPVILAVGRFFGQTAGHSKKQLELVRAFRRLVRGGARGWELHLVGGCSSEHVPYLERVRHEADGFPVRFHVDAPGSELRALYGRASIFWHATGLGEDERRHPHRLEHFGITTVEAMSAGAVPVVIARAGQTEIVTDGTDGFLFETLEELVEKTRRLVDQKSLREELAEGARHRAERFSRARFEEQIRVLAASARSA